MTLGIAIDTVIASFLALSLAILYFDLLARELNPVSQRASEYQHLRDLD